MLILDWYEQALQEFQIKLRGRLGEGCPGPKGIRILNRIVSVDSNGLTYEAAQTLRLVGELAQSKRVKFIGDSNRQTS